MSVLDDIELSLGHVKRFSESVIDLKCLLKVAATSFCFDNQVVLYFLEYCHFYQRSTVYMLSTMVWNYNQHFVSQSTAIWFAYSGLSPGFVDAYT